MSNPDFPLKGKGEINFHFEDTAFDFPNVTILTAWLNATAFSKNKKINFLNYIFCTDDFLHNLNVEYLNHDTLTDVITFSYSDKEKEIEGDVFISIDRVKENALELDVLFENELYRVMVHGLLHLLGLKDKTVEDKKEMTTNENEYLAILEELILKEK